MGSIAALPGIVAFPTFALGACRSFRMRQTNTPRAGTCSLASMGARMFGYAELSELTLCAAANRRSSRISRKAREQ